MIDSNTNELLQKFETLNDIYGKDNFRNNEFTQKLIAIGILNSLIFSKKIFKRNTDVGTFLSDYFQINLSKYMLSSRTTISGKITREIFEIQDSEDLRLFMTTLYNITNKIYSNQDINEKNMYDVIKEIRL